MVSRLFFCGPIPSDMRSPEPVVLSFYTAPEGLPSYHSPFRPSSPILRCSDKPKGLSFMFVRLSSTRFALQRLIWRFNRPVTIRGPVFYLIIALAWAGALLDFVFLLWLLGAFTAARGS